MDNPVSSPVLSPSITIGIPHYWLNTAVENPTVAVAGQELSQLCGKLRTCPAVRVDSIVTCDDVRTIIVIYCYILIYIL